jgi:hypothetical protein
LNATGLSHTNKLIDHIQYVPWWVGWR